MMTLIIVIHVIACAILITLVLIQRGRGAGLVESFAGVESMFGTKTNAFLTRTTTIMSIIFFITCLTLAVLSVKQSKSLMFDVKSSKPGVAKAGALKTEAPKTGAVKATDVKTADVKVEAVKTETIKAEAVKAEAPKVEVVKIEPAKPVAPIEKAKPEAGKAE